MRSRGSRHGRLAVALGLALAASPFTAVSPVAAADDLLPDLRMHKPYNIQIETRNAKKLLRFGTIVWNVGDGPLEVRANDRRKRIMRNVRQVIHTTAGKYEVHKPGAIAFYAGDGHIHFHIERFIVIQLYPASQAANPPASARRLRKIGFCLTDLVRGQGEFRPVNSTRRQYPYTGCGNRQSSELRMGISVGWGDDYKPFFAHQEIDITGLRGTYRMCATVNDDGLWKEKRDNYANNSYWMDMQINAARNRVSVVGHGNTACNGPAVSSLVFGFGG